MIFLNIIKKACVGIGIVGFTALPLPSQTASAQTRIDREGEIIDIVEQFVIKGHEAKEVVTKSDQKLTSLENEEKEIDSKLKSANSKSKREEYKAEKINLEEKQNDIEIEKYKAIKLGLVEYHTSRDRLANYYESEEASQGKMNEKDVEKYNLYFKRVSEFLGPQIDEKNPSAISALSMAKEYAKRLKFHKTKSDFNSRIKQAFKRYDMAAALIEAKIDTILIALNTKKGQIGRKREVMIMNQFFGATNDAFKKLDPEKVFGELLSDLESEEIEAFEEISMPEDKINNDDAKALLEEFRSGILQ